MQTSRSGSDCGKAAASRLSLAKVVCSIEKRLEDELDEHLDYPKNAPVVPNSGTDSAA